MKCGGKAYVGKSKSPMNLRINGHPSDAKKTDKLAVHPHFLQPGHNFERDVKLTIIKKVTKTKLSKKNPGKPAPETLRPLDVHTGNNTAKWIQT